MLNILFNPALIAMTALFLSVVWMLRNEKDRTRPLLVIALVINLFYGWLLSFVMGHQNGLVPWKYDYVLLNLDHALGVPGAAIAQMLQQVSIPLLVTYELMVPMMIAWFLVARSHGASGSIVVAYVVEMICGPILYAIVPACGPQYAFHGQVAASAGGTGGGGSPERHAERISLAPHSNGACLCLLRARKAMAGGIDCFSFRDLDGYGSDRRALRN